MNEFFKVQRYINWFFSKIGLLFNGLFIDYLWFKRSLEGSKRVILKNYLVINALQLTFLRGVSYLKNSFVLEWREYNTSLIKEWKTRSNLQIVHIRNWFIIWYQNWSWAFNNRLSLSWNLRAEFFIRTKHLYGKIIFIPQIIIAAISFSISIWPLYQHTEKRAPGSKL